MICYLCSKTIGPNEKSRDHVVPECFYSKEDLDQGHKPEGKSIPKVMAHDKCNNAFSLLEDYVLDIILNQHDPSLDTIRDQREGFKKRLDNKKYLEFLNNSTHLSKAYNSKGDLIGRIPVLYAYAEPTTVLLKKMVRGFVFCHKLHQTERIIPTDIPLYVDLLLEPQDQFFNQFKYVEKHIGETWEYRTGLLPDWNGYFEINLLDGMYYFGVGVGEQAIKMKEYMQIEIEKYNSESLLIRLQPLARDVYVEVEEVDDLPKYHNIMKALEKIRTDIFIEA